MSENEQLGVLAGIPAQQDRRHGQQRSSCSVQQRNDHPGSISAAEEELRTWAPTSGDDFPSPAGSGDFPGAWLTGLELQFAHRGEELTQRLVRHSLVLPGPRPHALSASVRQRKPFGAHRSPAVQRGEIAELRAHAKNLLWSEPGGHCQNPQCRADLRRPAGYSHSDAHLFRKLEVSRK